MLLFYSFGALDMTDSSPWFTDWFTCLYEKDPNGQAECTHIPQRFLPNDNLTEAVFTLWFCDGIWPIVLLGTSTSLYSDILQKWFPDLHTVLFNSKEGLGSASGSKTRESKAIGNETAAVVRSVTVLGEQSKALENENATEEKPKMQGELDTDA
ncbi:hypothetical protein HK102_004426, partial [Quaeritorhiza haematococci]